MVFTSFLFIFLFLPLTLLATYASGRYRNVAIVLASYVCYMYWRADFGLLLAASTLGNYALGRLIGGAEGKRRKLWLVVGLVANFLVLGYFKYAAFLIAALGDAASTVGLVLELPAPSIVLPIGISFFTFHGISYLVDCYRRDVEPTRSLLRFATYMALFPHLIAGPIVRYAEIEKQLLAPIQDRVALNQGVLLFLIGFSKKVLLANNLAPIADACFALEEPSFLEAWLGAVSYALQLYFDFSGYSDMAVGLGLMLGFRFPFNFDSPYLSRGFTEFWNRWHITLSRFLRDYLYIPLGGNRHGTARTCANLLLTMLLGGLWHGANWTFVVWGGYHGAMLALERLNRRRSLVFFLPAAGQVAVTFLLVCVGWVFFRAASVENALSMLGAMAVPGLAYSLQNLPLAIVALALPVVFFCPNSIALSREVRAPLAVAQLALFTIAVHEMLRQDYNPFLYFQF